MRLNHLNLPIPDVKATREFFETYFNFTCIEEKGDGALTVLKGEDDFTLVLMSESFNRNGQSAYPDAFHIGFLVNNQNEVDQLYTKLQQGGILLKQQPSPMRGVYGFYFHAPGNILTEVSCKAAEQ
jgi:catechol 2,3-dioxygenase-like lactoylglutathione lyase family enzyme